MSHNSDLKYGITKLAVLIKFKTNTSKKNPILKKFKYPEIH
jgi:hypothetical protein